MDWCARVRYGQPYLVRQSGQLKLTNALLVSGAVGKVSCEVDNFKFPLLEIAAKKPDQLLNLTIAKALRIVFSVEGDGTVMLYGMLLNMECSAVCSTNAHFYLHRLGVCGNTFTEYDSDYDE